MLTVQLAEPARLVPQVLAEIAKSAALAPVMEMLLMLTAAAPPLLSVTGWAGLTAPTLAPANVRLGGATERFSAVPVPARETV